MAFLIKQTGHFVVTHRHGLDKKTKKKLKKMAKRLARGNEHMHRTAQQVLELFKLGVVAGLTELKERGYLDAVASGVEALFDQMQGPPVRVVEALPGPECIVVAGVVEDGDFITFTGVDADDDFITIAGVREGTDGDQVYRRGPGEDASDATRPPQETQGKEK